MPLFKKINTDNNTHLLIWKIEESYNTLKSKIELKEDSKKKIEKFKSEKRKIEFLITRILLKELGFDDYDLKYKKSGAPYLHHSENFISISHSSEYVAVAVSNKKIGIDVEKNRNQIFRIIHKFINDKENKLFDSNNIEIVSIIWNAKEAMFKLCEKQGIDFKKNLIVTKIDIRKKNIKAELVFEDEIKKVSGQMDIFDNHTLVCVGFD
jgi:phosphopantetheinyl transferase